MDAPQSESLTGQYIGKYRIAGALGRRGLGAVYEVVQDSIGHRAAVKILPGQLAADPRHEKYAERFLDEARAVNLLDSPGVVRIFDFGARPDRSVYILMEYLDGEVLQDRVARLSAGGARLPLQQVLRIARQLAAVLAVAHGKGVLHRDLRPDNVMIVPDPEAPGGERVKILDFGLAKFLDTPERRTTVGTALGTPTYMSPEQCLGSDAIGGAADVYSLGVLLYELLAGRPPFSGEQRALLSAHVKEAPPPLAPLAPGAPAAVTELVHRMLQKDPGARPTMTEVAARAADLGEGDGKAPAARRPRAVRLGPALLLCAAALALGAGLGRLALAPRCPDAAGAAAPRR